MGEDGAMITLGNADHINPPRITRLRIPMLPQMDDRRKAAHVMLEITNDQCRVLVLNPAARLRELVGVATKGITGAYDRLDAANGKAARRQAAELQGLTDGWLPGLAGGASVG